MTGWSAVALAASLCFDLSRGGVVPPREPLPPKEPGPASARGSTSDGTPWGAARATVGKPPAEVLEWLLDHRNWKDPERVEMKVKGVDRPPWNAFHEVAQEVRVWGPFRVSWEEQWAYRWRGAKGEGGFEAFYQKVSGTSHVERLCGYVRGVPVPAGTDLFFYEEAKARGYDAEDMEKMHLDNLRSPKLGGLVSVVPSP